MNEERNLSKTEAGLGLTFLAVLLAGLGWAYVHQLDAPPPVTPNDPNWAAAKAEIRRDREIEQTAYRPEWLSSQNDDTPAPITR